MFLQTNNNDIDTNLSTVYYNVNDIKVFISITIIFRHLEIIISYHESLYE